MNREATAKDAGRTCPFCRFPLKAGMELTDCGVCAASHHSECWDENGGCAIALCAGGPGSGPAARPDAPPPPPQFQPPPPPPPAAPSRTNVGLIVAIIALAVAVSAVAVAVIVTRGGSGSAAEGPVAETTPVADTTTPEDTATPEPTAEETPTPRPPSDRAQIQRVLTAYYANVLEGDYDGAWRLLSPTYRSWKESEGGGYAKWVSQEEVHQERLDPTGLKVEILRTDGDVATIDVTGMSMVTPNDPNCDFHGVTWARRVNGKWRYDQGYLQNPARAAEWRPQREQTLGYVCETDGY